MLLLDVILNFGEASKGKSGLDLYSLITMIPSGISVLFSALTFFSWKSSKKYEYDLARKAILQDARQEKAILVYEDLTKICNSIEEHFVTMELLLSQSERFKELSTLDNFIGISVAKCEKDYIELSNIIKTKRFYIDSSVLEAADRVGIVADQICHTYAGRKSMGVVFDETQAREMLKDIQISKPVICEIEPAIRSMFEQKRKKEGN